MSSGKKPPVEKLATSREIYHRVRWDPRIDRTAYTIGYEDRSQGMQEIAFGEFEPDGDIPWHRVWSFRRGAEVMWDRKLRIDKLSEAALDDEPGTAPAGAAAAPLPIPLVEPAAGELIPLLPYRFDEAAASWVPAAEPGAADEPGAAVSALTVLTVLTFNVLCDLHDPEQVRSDLRLPHLLALLRAADADLIALQEVTPDFLRAVLAEPWIRRAYFASDSPRGDTVLPTGELLLSRLPVRRLVRQRFTRRKTALLAELAFSTAAGAASSLRVGVVHLSSNRGPRPQETRAAQLWTLLDALTAEPNGETNGETNGATVAATPAAPDGEAASAPSALLVGDFNAGEHELDELTAAYGFCDAWRTLHPADPGFTYDPERNALAKLTSLSGQRSRYDRVLVRSPRATVRAQAAALVGTQAITAALYPSDHYGLRCTLSLHPAAATAAVAAETAAAAALDAAPLTHHTALVIIPPQASWPPIQALRARHDKSYRRFMPHLTLLYGFVPEEHFPVAAARAAAAVRHVAPFSVQLTGLSTFVHRGSQTVWAQPKPAAALVELQAALQRAFPRCDEQSTRSPAGFTPHLTVAQQPIARDAAERAALEAQLAAWRRAWHPIGFAASEVALISRRGDEPFAVRYRIALGTGAILQAPDDAAVAAPAAAEEAGRPPDDAPPELAALLPAHARALALLRAAAARALARALPAGTALPAGAADALVHVLGSARLGTASAASDLDGFVAGPAALSREAFFAALTAELRATGELAHARSIPAAFVPVLELSLAGVAVDLAYVALPPDALAAAELFPAAQLPALWLAALPPDADHPTQLTLLGAADADALLATAARTSGLARYRQLTTALTRWAKQRAVHGNAHGFLGGFSWAVLAAWAVETHPAPAAASVEALLLHLFTQLAAWDFHRPIALANTAAYQPVRRREALLLLAPAAPTRNTARNVLRSTLSVLRAEFALARDALSASRTIPPYAPPTSSVLSLSFSLSGSGSGSDASAELASCRGWLDSQAIALFRELEDDYRLRPFATPHGLAIHLQSLTSAPLSTRVALAALARLSAQFSTWPERPAAVSLRTAFA